ncbi:MAG: 4Fe-4S dicluster domain-containing protein [Candidatus Eisenbacteria bacterium]|nr:4Fe-4S dicluster domain-containing protein [Candidatus Eisenbacteria bacterium]
MAGRIVITSEGEAFLERVSKLSGERITLCDQCGTCTASCPMIAEMDATPSQLMRMVQLGQTEVLGTRTMWLCASCFACTVRCPRGLDLSKVAEALRQVTLRRAVDRIDIRAIPKAELAELPPIALVGALRKLTG